MKSRYEGHPDADPMLVISEIYGVRLAVISNGEKTQEYFGTCVQKYIGD